MKFLFDFFPVLLFYITFKSHEDHVEGMITATGVLIMATLFQMSYTWLKHNRIEKIHVITMVLLVILGGATIIFKDPKFLIWKVTIANWLFAVAFAGSHFIGHKTIIKRMMDHAVKLPESVWTRLSISWISFFTAVGLLNLYIGFNYDVEIWVDFKFYGLMGLTLAFVLIQAVYVGKHAEELPEQKTGQADTGEGE
jgi:intracellular septation protein